MSATTSSTPTAEPHPVELKLAHKFLLSLAVGENVPTEDVATRTLVTTKFFVVLSMIELLEMNLIEFREIPQVMKILTEDSLAVSTCTDSSAEVSFDWIANEQLFKYIETQVEKHHNSVPLLRAIALLSCVKQNVLTKFLVDQGPLVNIFDRILGDLEALGLVTLSTEKKMFVLSQKKATLTSAGLEAANKVKDEMIAYLKASAEKRTETPTPSGDNADAEAEADTETPSAADVEEAVKDADDKAEIETPQPPPELGAKEKYAVFNYHSDTMKTVCLFHFYTSRLVGDGWKALFAEKSEECKTVYSEALALLDEEMAKKFSIEKTLVHYNNVYLRVRMIKWLPFSAVGLRSFKKNI